MSSSKFHWEKANRQEHVREDAAKYGTPEKCRVRRYVFPQPTTEQRVEAAKVRWTLAKEKARITLPRVSITEGKKP